MPTLRATTYRDSQRSFIEAIESHGISYKRAPVPSEPQAAGLTIEIIITGGWGVLAVACIAWAYARKSRRVNVTTKDNKVVWLEGYSADEAAKILESAKQIAVIDTKPEDHET